MKNFDTLLDEQMEDPEFRKEYVRLLEEGRRIAEAERDALAARLAAVEALARHALSHPLARYRGADRRVGGD